MHCYKMEETVNENNERGVRASVSHPLVGLRMCEDVPSNISMDVRYNSTSVKNSYGAGQVASEAIGAAIEWQTDQHQIVGFHLENKLCKVGSMLHSQGHNVTCPGHERCSATLRAVDQISEYDIGKQIGHRFAQDNVAYVRYVATDGDASASLEGYRMLCRQSPQKDRLTQHILVRHNYFRYHESFILPPNVSLRNSHHQSRKQKNVC